MKGKEKTKRALIIGDTSKFHLCTNQNYFNFRNLVEKKYKITGEIPYNEFGINFIDYKSFVSNLNRSEWGEVIKNSDVFIVHGEGLTEKHADYVYPYLYFSKIARERGLESHLVNFSMYESDPFLYLVKQFDYVASRDILTQEHLISRGIDSQLSFDCTLLSAPLQDYTIGDGHVALIRGRNEIVEGQLDENNYVRYNCCWKWERGDNILTLNSFQEYLSNLRNAKFSLTTSFHANIISFMSGIPFISLDRSNPKYLALDREILPNKLRDPNELKNRKNRKRIFDHYQSIYPELVRRAKLNVI